MSESHEKNRPRLFSLDAQLRAEADQLLEQSGIGRILQEEGFEPSGSYVMRTMTWRDLDFERNDDSPDWQWHWELGLKLAQSNWVWSLHCVDAYRDPRNLKDEGFYWGLRATNPLGGEIWKIDLWTAPREEFERASPNRALWDSRLTDDKRYNILAIKEVLWNLPEYRNALLSVHIYEAVLEYDIHDIDEFWDWWKKRYGK